jgi:hypothetical protein
MILVLRRVVISAAVAALVALTGFALVRAATPDPIPALAATTGTGSPAAAASEAAASGAAGDAAGDDAIGD